MIPLISCAMSERFSKGFVHTGALYKCPITITLTSFWHMFCARTGVERLVGSEQRSAADTKN